MIKCVLLCNDGNIYTEVTKEFIEAQLSHFSIDIFTVFSHGHILSCCEFDSSRTSEIILTRDQMIAIFGQEIEDKLYNAILFVKFGDLRPDYFDCIVDMDDETIEQIKNILGK